MSMGSDGTYESQLSARAARPGRQSSSSSLMTTTDAAGGDRVDGQTAGDRVRRGPAQVLRRAEVGAGQCLGVSSEESVELHKLRTANRSRGCEIRGSWRDSRARPTAVRRRIIAPIAVRQRINPCTRLVALPRREQHR